MKKKISYQLLESVLVPVLVLTLRPALLPVLVPVLMFEAVLVIRFSVSLGPGARTGSEILQGSSKHLSRLESSEPARAQLGLA